MILLKIIVMTIIVDAIMIIPLITETGVVYTIKSYLIRQTSSRSIID